MKLLYNNRVFCSNLHKFTLASHEMNMCKHKGNPIRFHFAVAGNNEFLIGNSFNLDVRGCKWKEYWKIRQRREMVVWWFLTIYILDIDHDYGSLIFVLACCHWSSMDDCDEKYPKSWISCNSLKIFPLGNISIIMVTFDWFLLFSLSIPLDKQ